MNSAFVSLLWKECREHVWKVVALVVVVFGLHVWALDATEPGPDHYAIPMFATIWFVLPLGAVFLGMGAAAGERSQGTAAWLRSLPIDPRRVAVTKLAVGFASLLLVQAAAVALTIGLMSLADWYEPGSLDRTLNALSKARALFDGSGGSPAEAIVLVPTLYVLFISGSFFLWVAALGANCISEGRAATIGLVVGVTLWTVFIFALYLVNENAVEPSSWRPLLAYAAAVLPGGICFAFSWGQLTSWSLFVPFVLVHGVLIGWYVWRYGRVVVSKADASARPVQRTADAWLGPPHRTRGGALAWKQCRQALPVLFAGFVGAIGITAVLLITCDWERWAGEVFATVGSIVMPAFLTLGCCAGLVGGVGLMSDLEPRLATFWRSRPINPNAWFWIAVGVGLALLVAAFGVPVLVGEELATRLSPDVPGKLSPAIVISLSFAAGVFSAALVRRPVYASLMGIGVAMSVMALANYERMPWTPDAIGPALVVGCALLIVAAWYAVRRDWAVLR